MFPTPRPKIHTRPKPKPVDYHVSQNGHDHQITNPKIKK